MPKRSRQGLFSRLARLRARLQRIRNEMSRLSAVALSKDLEMQLRNAATRSRRPATR
jgi:hypothetical protein